MDVVLQFLPKNIDTISRWLGYVTMAYFSLRTANWIRINMFSGVNVRATYNSNGTNWAVVTGASDGIGRSFAIELAKRGMNVVLVARTKVKLDEVAQTIHTQTKMKAKVITFDFAKADEKDYEALFEQLDELNITMLVNNVGISYESPMYLDAQDVSIDVKMLKVNCETQIRMSHYCVKRFKAVAPQRSAIIDLSSTFARLPAPLLGAYGGTKAFNSHFSQSLALELDGSSIDVLAVYPQMVVSQMSKIRRASFSVPDSDSVARHTLNRLGKTTQTEGHFNHVLIAAVLAWLPSWMVSTMIRKNNAAMMRKATAKKLKLASTE